MACEMKRLRIKGYGLRVLVLVALTALVVLAGCSSSKNFGQRKAPKNCHSCTRW